MPIDITSGPMMNLYDTRLQALNWLFAAIRPWLFQDPSRLENFPNSRNVDWKSVGDLAYFHNLEPLLFWVVSSYEDETDVPSWLKEKWEKAYFGTFLKNEKHLDVLDLLLDRCKRDGVPVIVLKGPALIGRIYRDPALRPMTDLDILCREREFGRVADIAREMGYKPGVVGENPVAIQHVAMQHVDTASLLELHFRPYETIRNHRLFMASAWERREWIDVNRISIPVLSLDMELAFDVAHLAHHQFDVSLKHHIDIAGLLVRCREQFDWSRTDACLREFGLERIFELTSGCVSRMMRFSPASQPPRHAFKTKAQKEFEASLRDLLGLLDQDRLLDIKGVIRWGRMALRNQEGFREKLLFIRNRIFPFLDGGMFQHHIESRGDILLYYVRRLLFYFDRLLLNVTSLEGMFRTTHPDSLAARRAAAKNRLTAQLCAVETMGQRGKPTTPNRCPP